MSEDRSKREREGDDEKADDIGPLPADIIPSKKIKALAYEQVYLENLPSAEMYEKSYMHRDIITHTVCTKTDFLITASSDGHVKFWKKHEQGVEFVKHFRAHLGKITSVAVTKDGLLLATAAEDKALKVFDVINFDMINMLRIGYIPSCCVWLYAGGAATAALACCEQNGKVVHVYDGHGGNSSELVVLNSLHSSPLTFIEYNEHYEAMVSGDESGMIEYWSGPATEYSFPKNVSFQHKMDTDLYEFVKHKTVPLRLTFSPNGKTFAIMSSDRKVRLFHFLTGKLYLVFDESLQLYTNLQQKNPQLPNMEFGRRLSVEKEIEKKSSLSLANALFDDSGHFLFYATMMGIKVVNLHTSRCVRIIGKEESVRYLHLALHQGQIGKTATHSIEMEISDNPSLRRDTSDPSLFCTAYRKNRFYIFTRREPEDTKKTDSERDIFNEKPSKEEQMAATQSGTGSSKLSSLVTLHTSLGDIQIKLFPEYCPKTVENFCVHASDGYYNGHIFHRVIKQFMIQTGDPTGTGTGGESIWGGEFEDELHPMLKHDRPYVVSMANAGPNTNGSQFFITVIATPWLDNKHTVFGRVTKGMDVAQLVSETKTHPKTDKPYEDIKILNVTLH